MKSPLSRLLIWSGLLLAVLFTVPAASALAASGLSIGNASVLVGPSGTRNAAFQVTLSAPASSPVSVAYATSDGTASAGTDYTSTSGTLTLATGVTAGTIYVPVIGTTSDASGLTFTVTLSGPVNATITNGTGTCTITHDAAPVAVSVSPNPAAGLVGEPQVLTTTASSVGGPGNFAKIGFSIGGLASPATSLYAEYVVGTNLLYLANSSGTYIGGFTPGSNNVISTGLATLNCAGTSVTTNGNNLVVNWSLTPTSSLQGTQSTYLLASDVFGLSSGWQKLGSWTVSPESAPVAVSVTPSSSVTQVNQPVTLTSNFTYVGGAENLASIGLNLGKLSSPAASLYAKYVPSSNLLYLANASGTYIGGFAPGSSNVITTTLATLNCASTSVVENGSQVTVHWNFTPTSSLNGMQNVYADISDDFGMASGWQNLATWDVVQEVAPNAVSVTPSVLNTPAGTAETVTTTCNDAGGGLNLNKVSLCVGKLTSTSTSLYGICTQSQGQYLLYLANASGAYIGGFAPGSNNTINTALGNLNCASTSVTVTGNQIAVKWSIAPAAALAGSQSVFVDITDNQGQTSNWQKLGAWTIFVEAAPVAVSVTPNPATSQENFSVSFVTTVSSVGGAGNISKVGFASGLASPSTSIYAEYVASTNLLYLANSNGTYVGGFTPGSFNVITTTTASLNCAETTVATNGDNLVVTWSLSGGLPMLGTHTTYLDVSDNYGMSSGWTSLGSWLVTANAISGQVTQNGSLAAGVTVKMSGTSSGIAVTDTNGAFTFSNLGPGSYTVTPVAQAGITYQAPSLVVTFGTTQISTASIYFYGGQLYTISGQALLYANGGATTGLNGVTVSATGNGTGNNYGVTVTPTNGVPATAVTDTNGDFSFSVPPGTYSVAQSLTGDPHIGAPISVTVPSTGAGAPNGTAVFADYQISGNVNLLGAPTTGVMVSLGYQGTSGNMTVTCDSSGNYVFAPLNAGPYSVFAGNSPGTSEVYSSTNPVNITLPTSGVTGISPNGQANFTGTEYVAPPNDDFANAQAIAGMTGTVNGTTVNSTLETGEPNPPQGNSRYGGAGYDSVWYQYSAPSGAAGVTFSGADIINLYSGTNFSNLALLGSGNSSINAPVTGGSSYYVQVMEEQSALGTDAPTTFTLSWTAYLLPANDNFENAQVLTGTSGSTTGSNFGATVEASEPPSGGYSVWYQYTAPTSSAGQLSVVQSGVGLSVTIFTGSSLATLTSVASGTATASVTTTPGTVYSIQVDDTTSTSVPTNFTLSWNWSTPPANDYFANAQPISGTSGSVNGSTIGATVEAGEPNPNNYSVWYQYTAPSISSGSVVLTQSNYTAQQEIRVFTGTTISALTTAPNSSLGGGSVVFNATAGGVYYIQVQDFGGGASNFTLNWSWTAGPPNDNFANAAIMSGTSGQETGNLLGATLESGEPNATYASVWYQYTPSANGIFSYSFGNNPDRAGLLIYTGSSLSSLVKISTPAEFSTTAGTTYSIQVFAQNGFGPFTFNWFWNSTPANDNFANAAVLTGNSGTANGSTIGSTVESGEPNATTNSVWYQYSTPAGTSGDFSIAFLASGSLAAYTGSSLTSLTAVTLVRGPNAVSFGTAPGTVYYIQVEAGSVATEGLFTLNWTWDAAPANDDFVNAQALTGTSGSVNGTITGASVEPGEPNSRSNSVWYTYTVPSSPAGSVLFTMGGAGGSTTVPITNIYTGTALANLVEVLSFTNSLSVTLTAGTTYYLQVDDGGTPGLGAFTLTWTFGQPPANDNFANAQPISGTSGSVNGTTLFSTDEPGDPWTGGGSVWYSYTQSGTTGGWLAINHGANVYTGSSLSNLNTAGGSSAPFSFPTSPGVTYYIEILSGPVGQPFTLSWSWSLGAGLNSFPSGGGVTLALPAKMVSGHSA